MGAGVWPDAVLRLQSGQDMRPYKYNEIRFLAATGARASELIQIRVKHIISYFLFEGGKIKNYQRFKWKKLANSGRRPYNHNITPA